MMAGGLPVIASNVDGLNQLVEGAGILFPCGDYKKLADIITELLTNKIKYEEIRRRCIDRAKKYDIHKMATAYMNVYKELFHHDIK